MLSRSITVTIDGFTQPFNVSRFELFKEFEKHSVGVLDIKYSFGQEKTARQAATILENEWTPIIITMTNTPDTSDWYGYIHHSGVSSDNRSDESPVIRYTVIGTSLPLNEQRQRSWVNRTSSSVVRDIAGSHRLRSVIERTQEVLPYVPQAGESDWQVLKRQAKAEGYRVWVDGSTLLFVNPLTLLSGTRDRSIVTFIQDSQNGVGDSLIKWKSEAGSMIPRPRGRAAKHLATGTDSRNSKVLSSLSQNDLGSVAVTPTLTVIDTSQRLNGFGQVSKAAAVRAVNSRGWITAEAVVWGSPSMNPGTVVNIAGATVPEAQRGLWMVTGASHNFDNSRGIPTFTTTLMLERDQYYGPTFNTAFRTINTQDTVPATMRNGVYWEANILENVNVG